MGHTCLPMRSFETASATPESSVSDRRRHAVGLFEGLPSSYDRMAEILSFGQNGRWRRFLASRVDGATKVLDVATGTAHVAIAVAGRRGRSIIGLDQSEPMLAEGRRRIARAGLEDRIHLIAGNGERLPFPDDAFDAVTFTYLLRYVDDPQATLQEMARVLRPGGVMANLEFHVPPRRWRWLWVLYTRGVMPVAGRVVSPAWHDVGRFLGRSISDFYRRLPLEAQLDLWRAAGIEDVQARVMSLGGGVVIWGRKS
jgi:demethylmenaquinone methyltransferase/2-methoxy-6-polyprenyl-1,4-benzoquinol methylase